MRSVNKVILLGNLTRNPELKQTEGKKPVCTFGLATNRSWTTETGESGKSQSFTVSLPGINGQRFATGIWPKAEKYT
jgi:single stranded DNA-binding protein